MAMKHLRKEFICLCFLVLLTTVNCEQCPTGCETCTDDVNNVTCDSCYDGFWMSGSSCLQCSKNCASCSYSSSCDTCKPEYYLPGENCNLNCSKQCLNSECDDTSGKCTTCPSGRYGNYCNQECTLCKNEKCNKIRCTNGCKTGYYEHVSGELFHCLNCPTNCLSCKSIDVCMRCKDGYYLKGHEGSAYCERCNASCAQCIDIYNCLRCGDGNYGNNCEYRCLDTVHKCTVCNGNVWNRVTCLQCESGSVLLDNTCKTIPEKCPVNCERCSLNICQLCKKRWYGSLCDKSCSKSIPHCVACHETDDELMCIMCEEEYSVSAGICRATTKPTLAPSTSTKAMTTSSGTTESTSNFHPNTFLYGLFSGFGISICTIILTVFVCSWRRRRKKLQRANNARSSRRRQIEPFYENQVTQDMMLLSPIGYQYPQQESTQRVTENNEDTRQARADDEIVWSTELPSTSNDNQHYYSSLVTGHDEHVYKGLTSM